jgi:hypothetical protein
MLLSPDTTDELQAVLPVVADTTPYSLDECITAATIAARHGVGQGEFVSVVRAAAWLSEATGYSPEAAADMVSTLQSLPESGVRITFDSRERTTVDD